MIVFMNMRAAVVIYISFVQLCGVNRRVFMIS